MDLENKYHEIVNKFPIEFRLILTNNANRVLWQVNEVLKLVPRGGHLVDIGAGVIPFMLICQQLGFKTTIIDDYQDSGHTNAALANVLQLNKAAGVTILNADVFQLNRVDFEAGGYDLVFSSDSMEHWHNSPKKLFHSLWKGMNDGALFWLGVPNCANLRKRLMAPFGKSKWTKMEDWYEPEIFRGHVREPDTEDLVYIAKDLGSQNYKIIGRNWIGHRHPSLFIRFLTPAADKLLRKFPGLCSDIYLYARK